MDLGSVRVKIEGDSTKLQADLKTAEAAAANAGGKIAQAFNKSAGSMNNTTATIKQVASGITQTGEAAEKAGQKVQSFVGAIPGFGVAAERFIGMVPGFGDTLTSLFPLFGATAFLAVIDRIAPKILEAAQAFDPMTAATERAKQAAESYDDIIQKLGADIRKLNAEALEFAVGKANALAIGAANKVVEQRLAENDQKLLELELSRTREILKTRQAAVDAPVNPYDEGGGISLAAAVRQLKAAKLDVETASKALNAFQLDTVDKADQATALTRDALLKGVDDRKKAGDESGKNAKRHTQEMAQADQLALAELKSNHQVTIGEEIKFYQQRLAVESANTERHRDITMKLGTLNQERNKLIESIAKRGADVMDAEAKKAQQHVAKFTELALESEALANRIAADMVKAQERAQENQTMRTAAGAEGAAEGRKLQNERAYGLAVVHTLQQQVQHMRDLAQFDAEKGNARIAELQSLQKIAEAAGDETKAAQYSLQLERERAAITNQQYAAESAILELKQKQSVMGQLQGQLQQIGSQIPGQLGGALAGGIMSGNPGKAIGQEIRGALQGIGQQLLGTVFQAAIQQLVVSLGLNTLANTVLQALFPVQQGATAGLIAALGLNTAAVSAQAASGAVGAGVGAAGKVAGIAGTAASAASGGLLGSVISGAISAAGSLVSAFLIIRAIHGTTAEVRALRRSGGIKPGSGGISGADAEKPAQTGYMSSLAKIFGADAIRVNIVAVSPLAFTNGLFSVLGNLFGFANGGRPPTGRPSIVGERGPEMFIPDQAGRIVPNHMLNGGAGLSFPSASSNSGGINIGSITANGVNNPREFVREVARQLPAYLKSTNPKYSPASR